MSNEPKNGKDLDVHGIGAAPAPAAKPPGPSLDAQLDAQIRQILGIVCRGILISSPGIPPEALVLSISRVTGELAALMLSGDLAGTLKFRAMIKEAFVGAVARQPIAPPAGAVPQNLNG